MWQVRPIHWLVSLVVLLTLTACSMGLENAPGAAPLPTAPKAAAPTIAPGAYVAEAPKAAPPPVALQAPAQRQDGGAAAPPAQRALDAPKAVAPTSGGPPSPDKAGPDQNPAANSLALIQVDRDIIKTAQVVLSAEDVDTALSGVINLVAQVRGYILTQRTEGAGAKRVATIALRVPAATFEETLDRLSKLPGVRIDSAQIDAQDVTEQLVDMESRRRNLEATEARIRSFLDQAKTVEESLRVNQQLAEIQRQIEEIKGRMEFTRNRAAFSTINLSIRVLQPTPTPTATPTQTPTPTPTPTATPIGGWNPGDTARDASKVTITLVQRIVDAAIWVIIVGLPLLVPVLLILGLAALWRRMQPPAPPHANPPAAPAPTTPPSGD